MWKERCDRQSVRLESAEEARHAAQRDFSHLDDAQKGCKALIIYWKYTLDHK